MTDLSDMPGGCFPTGIIITWMKPKQVLYVVTCGTRGYRHRPASLAHPPAQGGQNGASGIPLNGYPSGNVNNFYVNNSSQQNRGSGGNWQNQNGIGNSTLH